jgi:nucleoside 2-deoxyribosyltransferase
MKVYLAGPWIARYSMPHYAQTIRDAGHTITHEWWRYDGEGEHKEDEKFLEQCAKNDVDGVKNSDIVIVWNTAKSEGKAVEQGLAIAYEKPIVVITPGEKPASNIFHYLRGNYTHVRSLPEAINTIKEQYQ